MKASELKEKSVEELQQDIDNLAKDQFNYRMQKSTGQLGQTHLCLLYTSDAADE